MKNFYLSALPVPIGRQVPAGRRQAGTTPLKKNVTELIKNIEMKGLKQNIRNLSIIEILKQSSLSLFRDCGKENHFREKKKFGR